MNDPEAEVLVRSPTQGAGGMIFVLFGVFWALGSFGAEVSSMTSMMWAIPGTVFGLAFGIRAFRMGIRTSRNGLTIRNLGRTYEVDWSNIQSIRAGRSNNITGAVWTLYIETCDGQTIVGRGASSYSAKQVAKWRDEVLSAAPAGWPIR